MRRPSFHPLENVSGITIDTLAMEFRLPDERIATLKDITAIVIRQKNGHLKGYAKAPWPSSICL